MAIIPQHIVDDIMQTSRVEEVIGEFVQLKRSGSNLKGLSPFTDEKTPSFVVSPAKQIFKCFSSGKGGTVVSFLMEKEHYSYPEALRWLADKYGIQIPEDKPATPEELAAISERESLHIINEFARDHFCENLHKNEEGIKIGKSYFTERGFQAETIEKFQLGYCLNQSDHFTAAALEKGYKIDYLEKVGLSKSKNDKHFDFFRGRVMFPIHSISGRILGFGGRTLFTEKKIAKYFNSPESIVYNKSDILYGLYFAKSDIIKYDNCFLCEGYTDVISMYQCGIQNVVSSSGTALTKQQIRLVKRYTKNITILYDGDAAGIKASFRGIDLVLEEGMNVKVVLFPQGEDPDSYAKAVNKSELEAYIEENTQDFISFKTDVLIGSGESDPIKHAAMIKEILNSVSIIPDQITRNVYMQSIAERFGMSEQVLSSELIKLRTEIRKKQLKSAERKEVQKQNVAGISVRESNTAEAKVNPGKEHIDHNEYDLMRILVLYGALPIVTEQINENGSKEKVETHVTDLICHELNIDELVFDRPVFNKMHQMITDSLADNILLKASYFKRQEDQKIVQFVTEIELNRHELSDNWVSKHKIFTHTEKDKLQHAVMGSIYSFKSSKVEKRIKNIQAVLMDQGDTLEEQQLNELLTEQVALEQVKRTISENLGRIVIR